MRAIVLHAPKDIRLEDRPEPVAGPGEVLVRVASVGVCGSDLPRMLVKGAWKMPLITGHEFSGHIEALGEGVSGWETGELVAVAPLVPCYACDQCQTGNFSRCRDYDYFGSRRDGAYAEYVAVPVGNLLKAPQHVDPRAIAMTDPASIAIHAIWKAGGLRIGQTGGVVGCGPIGLFAIQWMRLMGASEVIAVDVSEEKLALAREAGATITVLSADLPSLKTKADVVIEAVGIDPTINAAVMLAGPGGHVAFIGIPVPDVKLSNASFQYFLRQEISLHGSWNSFSAPFPGPQWTTTLEKFGTGELKWEFMISHDLDLAELPGIFERFDKKDLHFSKVLFRP
ncbi:galactitol-1-phosphate 5-dehydrogenase [Cereibacter changlensis JA139]|uniref:Galactitol-1-phosphate 5-dehydrogenase n=2 Tax=Cereibacter changlensis TaxID=402884 RepID=A0A2T4JT95_9RHOB|nr:galactitol-1-phosphate 5-dehydrogenase [Cereibacter changlensis]PTE20993.1 galactitol-1-phosphate 5-dehydrogenase [Cereibacter changlensis JA139]PZX56173.1 L-iditol 2-dehydrogenase [Cereibacter changlensis]